MTLTMKFTRKSFWGSVREYTEDTMIPLGWEAAERNIEKGLNAVLKSTDYTLQISEGGQWYTIWMENSDAENKILTVRFNESLNGYTDEKMTKRRAKKAIENWIFKD